MTGPKGRLSESTTSAAVESEGCLIALIGAWSCRKSTQSIALALPTTSHFNTTVLGDANQTSGMNAKVNGRFEGLGSKAPEQ